MVLSDFWKTLILATVPALVGGGVVVGGIEYLSKDREQDIRMVEIGLGILRADPVEKQISPAREWAIRLIEKHSGEEFNSEDKRLLLTNPINLIVIPPLQGSINMTGGRLDQLELNDPGDDFLLDLENTNDN